MEDPLIPINSQPLSSEQFNPTFGGHLKILLWKQYLTHKRSMKGIICIALSPLILCLFLFFSQIIANNQIAVSYPDPPTAPLGTINKCISGPGTTCITIGYSIIGELDPQDDWVTHTLNYVANKSGLVLGVDIQNLNTTNPNNLTAALTDFNNWFVDNPNITQIAILFCTSNLVIPNQTNTTEPLEISCANFPLYSPLSTRFYLISYNQSMLSTEWQNNGELPFPTYPLAASLKLLIDSGIIDFANPNRNPDPNAPPYLQATYSSYPSPPLRYFQGIDVVNADGTLYFFIAPMVVFIILISELAQEKDKRLRQGLIVVGVGHFTYYLSWVVLAIVYSLIIPIVLLATANIMQFELFTQVPFFLLFLIYFLFTLNMCFFAMFLYTLIPSAKAGNTVAYAILLVGIVLQLFLSQYILLQFVYDDTNSLFVQSIVNLFNLYPPFPFAKIWGNICQYAGNHFSPADGRWEPGPGYTWDLLTSNSSYISGYNQVGDPFTVPQPIWSIWWFLLNLVIYSGLIFYFDHIVASNRGSADRFYFFFTKNFWRNVGPCKNCIQRKRALSIINKPRSSSSGINTAVGSIDTVAQERERVILNSKNEVEARGIRIENVSKIYRKFGCGIRSKGDVQALNGVHLEIDEGELLGLLGHNGAGKTTLINIMTGVLGGYTGNITISGLDIEENKSEVKQLVGVCPQFDILWNEMTAKEHLEMFAVIKGLPKNMINQTCDKLLKDVNLTKVGDHLARTFSGGMKRRLSMAIACVGNPKIIFLDEPTTGMDPKNRRQVWELIKELKRGKVVILTTHAMEEADALSDRIAVIVDGKFKCIGTSLFLKNNFGEGYRLTLVVNPNDIELAKNIVRMKIPSATLLDDAGGSLVFSIPVMRIQELNAFFKILENKDHDEQAKTLKRIVADWGLSHTTLEEVFMKVTGKKEKRQRMSVHDMNKIKKE